MNALQFTERRKKLFRSQQAAAEALGVTQQALSNWETGRREVPLIVVKFFECLEKAEEVAKGLAETIYKAGIGFD